MGAVYIGRREMERRGIEPNAAALAAYAREALGISGGVTVRAFCGAAGVLMFCTAHEALR